MSKIKTCDYCSNCRIYEMTEEDELDLNFCYDDERDLSARSIFISEDKQFDIMVVSGAGEPQRLEFRHWNKEAQRWIVYNTIYLKRCINCGREITEYPEFIDKKDKKIVELKKENKIFKHLIEETKSENIEDFVFLVRLLNGSYIQKLRKANKRVQELDQQLKKLPNEIIEEIRRGMGNIESILINCGNGKEDALCWFNNILKEILKKYGVEDE